MKCHKQGTDLSITATVSANGQECLEFTKPSDSNAGPNVLEYFVPVSEGQKITLLVHVQGTMHQGCVDFLADGNFVEHRRINRKGAKLVNERYSTQLVFKRTLTPKEDPDHDLILPKVVYGELSPKLMHTFAHRDEKAAFGVGSIAIVFYSNQTDNEPRMTDPAYASQTDFNQRLDGPTGGIRPTHELVFTTIKKDVRRDRQTIHLKEAKDFRPGGDPPLTIIFYYRSREAINKFGCILAPVGTHEVPSDGSQTAAPTTTNTVAATAPNMQQQNGQGSTLSFPESSMRKYGTTNKGVADTSCNLKTVEGAGAKASAVQQQKGVYTPAGSSTPSQTAAPPKKKQLMKQKWPSTASPSIGLSGLEIRKDSTAPPGGTDMGSRKPSTTMPQPSITPKNPRPDHSVASLLRKQADRLSNGSAAPPPPPTGVGAGNPWGLNAPPSGIAGLGSRRPIAQSLLDDNIDRNTGDDAPPAVTTAGPRDSSDSECPPRRPQRNRSHRVPPPSSYYDELYDASGEDAGPDPRGTAVRSLQDPTAPSPPRRNLGRRRSGQYAESPSDDDDDRSSNDGAAPPAPLTAARSSGPPPYRHPPYNPNRRGARKFAPSLPENWYDRVSDNDNTAPPPSTNQGFFKQFLAPKARSSVPTKRLRGSDPQSPIDISSGRSSSEDEGADEAGMALEPGMQYPSPPRPGMGGPAGPYIVDGVPLELEPSKLRYTIDGRLLRDKKD